MRFISFMRILNDMVYVRFGMNCKCIRKLKQQKGVPNQIEHI